MSKGSFNRDIITLRHYGRIITDNEELRALIHERNSEGSPFLISAIRYENKCLVRLALELCASPTAKDKWGWTPLIHAMGNDSILKLLVETYGVPYKRDLYDVKYGQYAMTAHFSHHADTYFQLIAFRECNARGAAVALLSTRVRSQFNLPRDVALLIARVVWSTRRRECWGTL